MNLTVLPDIGDLLRLSPQYNSATLVELLNGWAARSVYWISAADPEHPARDAFGAAGIEIHDLTSDWRWAEDEATLFPEFLSQYPQGRERLRAAARLDETLRAALSVPMTAQRVTSPELLGIVGEYHAGRREVLGEGPGNAHRGRRLSGLRGQLAGLQGVVFASLDDVPDLLDIARLPDVSAFAPGERSRVRALADRALRLEEGDDLEALVAALLREGGDMITPKAELQYAAANIYLAVGDLASARDLLEGAAHAVVDHPRSLPGLVLARLGQVRDALGEREAARRAYQAALALSFIPQVARETAEQGLRAPFELEPDSPPL
ncbi:tetratricopeptide repeat protein [Deinococcus peraridilitoris]|uniref:Tetratricopeptide repeat protein n=1 Tax=Deinococcus peraridilitoris (strain DSM 19664 / LMG 22246 / CIP 109416 / KR-200) TaxID=937777 RepID=L0A5T9_DEIPD|nr:hypothetical protein [Deinococcus peraridilitoris]AFZ69248.1 hypothetical protein Deipe_3824 [Deinococcus peraridilitoris DSM 19664]